ncbi:MAG: hypothetical protein IJL66_00185 [Lachnospiraceae bacterium]|nr:hypothetical protein [Lachnospiraceae bacterium]
MTFTCGEGRLRVRLEVIRHEEGLTAVLTGGEKTHVGAVVLALPRTSLKGEGASCDCAVVPVPGHKDDVVAKVTAQALCTALGEPVCVSAGIHIDHASAEEIRELSENCAQVTRRASEYINESGKENQ